MKKVFFVSCRASTLETPSEQNFLAAFLSEQSVDGKLLVIILNGMLPSESDDLCGQIVDQTTVVKVNNPEELGLTFSRERDKFDYCLVAIPSHTHFCGLPAKLVNETFNVSLLSCYQELNSIMVFNCFEGSFVLICATHYNEPP